MRKKSLTAENQMKTLAVAFVVFMTRMKDARTPSTCCLRLSLYSTLIYLCGGLRFWFASGLDK
jgi:hypothetical protein